MTPIRVFHRPARTLALAALAVCAAPSALDADTTGEPISFYDGGWENIRINTAIATYIVQHGYDVPAEIVESNAQDMQRQILSGEIDVNMEMWRTLMSRWVSQQLERETIVDLGPTYEKAVQGFYVPTYVIEGDPARGIEPVAPELERVSGLSRYADQFKAATAGDRAPWLNCLPSWACRTPNRIKMSTYGLDPHFRPVELSSEAELNKRLLALYEAGKPFVTYYWDPSPMLGRKDMTKLEEPPYTDACWKAIEQAQADYEPGDTAAEACAYETVSINKFMSADAAATWPRIADFLASMNVGTDTVRRLAGLMVQRDLTPRETALHFLRNKTAQWRDWVPHRVQQRVIDALHRS